MTCPCGSDHADDAPGSQYWVSVIDGPRKALVAGPYPTHSEAIADLEHAREVAYRDDGATHFYYWGTARSDAESARKPGILNEKIRALKESLK